MPILSAPTQAPTSLIGRCIGQYRILRKIGEGGMGAVYEATHESIGQRAAVKVMHQNLAEDEKNLARFLNEARAISMIKHPGLVKIFDYGQMPEGPAYILMEFLEGEALGERLKKTGGKMALELSAEVVRQTASALDTTHKSGIIHRDLKPENLFLVPDPIAPEGERVKILDFGVAKFSDPSGRKTTVGLILGTPTYMAPEQCEAADNLTEKVDVYSVGVLFYEILAGRPPFEADTASAIMRQHMFKEPRPLKEVVPELPEDILQLVHAMMAKKPEDRPSMAQVVQLLGTRRSGRQPLPRRTPVLLLGAMAFFLVAAIAGWLLWPPKVPAAPRRPDLSSVPPTRTVPAPAPQPAAAPSPPANSADGDEDHLRSKKHRGKSSRHEGKAGTPNQPAARPSDRRFD